MPTSMWWENLWMCPYSITTRELIHLLGCIHSKIMMETDKSLHPMIAKKLFTEAWIILVAYIIISHIKNSQSIFYYSLLNKPVGHINIQIVFQGRQLINLLIF